MIHVVKMKLAAMLLLILLLFANSAGATSMTIRSVSMFDQQFRCHRGRIGPGNGHLQRRPGIHTQPTLPFLIHLLDDLNPQVQALACGGMGSFPTMFPPARTRQRRLLESMVEPTQGYANPLSRPAPTRAKSLPGPDQT